MLDSRGNPTVACEVTLAGGASGQAAVPSGASTGAARGARAARRRRALRRQGRPARGRGSSTASSPRPSTARDAADQAALDDGAPAARRHTPTSAGSARTPSWPCRSHARSPPPTRRGAPLWRCSTAGGEPLLPMPMVNVISGGAHARRGESTSRTSSSSRSARPASPRRSSGPGASAVRRSSRTRPRAAGRAGRGRGRPRRTACRRTAQALELARRGHRPIRPRPGRARRRSRSTSPRRSSSCDGGYRLVAEGRTLDAGELVDELESWCDAHPVVSIEDPLAEDDWDGVARGDTAARRQDPAGRRRPLRHRHGAPRARHRLRRRQRGAREAEPDAARCRRASTCVELRAGGRVRDRSSRPVQATPRTTGSPTSRSAGVPGRSRSARRRAPSAPRSGTDCSASKPNSATAHVMPEPPRSRTRCGTGAPGRGRMEPRSRLRPPSRSRAYGRGRSARSRPARRA